MEKNKFILIALALSLVVVLGYYFTTSFHSNDELFGWKIPTSFSQQDLLAYSHLRDANTLPKGLPVRLKIPIIGVDTAIEDAYITPDGRMDVPAGSVNVAWFALGPQPGSIGSAVIGGHYGIKNNVPFVFYKLNTLKVGDKVYVVDDKNKVISFEVRFIKLFDRNSDASTVFSSDDGLSHLNLITCEGIWNKVDGTYPQRRVIFTDMIPTDSSAISTLDAFSAVKIKLPATAIPQPKKVIKK